MAEQTQEIAKIGKGAPWASWAPWVIWAQWGGRRGYRDVCEKARQKSDGLQKIQLTLSTQAWGLSVSLIFCRPADF